VRSNAIETLICRFGRDDGVLPHFQKPHKRVTNRRMVFDDEDDWGSVHQGDYHRVRHSGITRDRGILCPQRADIAEHRAVARHDEPRFSTSRQLNEHFAAVDGSWATQTISLAK